MKKKEYRKRMAQEKAKRPSFDFENGDDTKKVLKIFIGVILFIFLMFVVTKFITGEWTLSAKQEQSTDDTRTNKTICGSIFNLDDTSEYYVLMYDFDSDDAKLYDIIKSNYETNKSKKNLYILDLGNILNKSCVTTGDVNIVNNASELKVNGPTLLKIDDKTITDYKFGKEEIKSYFNSL